MAHHTPNQPAPRPDDNRRINLSEDYEVYYWAYKFGVSPERLREVVRGTGPALRDVMRKLWR